LGAALAALVCLADASLSSGWYFFAAGKEAHNEFSNLEPGFDKTGWLPVSLPHSFDELLPEDEVFGWYVTELDVPKYLEGHELVLDLGIIDDADITYMNGHRVGSTGSFADSSSSGYLTDRLYVVPSTIVRYGQSNIVAIQVKDFGGIGGMLGRPYLGGSIVTSLRCRFVAGACDFERLGDTEYVLTNSAEIAIPDLEWDKRQPRDPSVGWYIFDLKLPAELTGDDLLVDLGRVYDVAECYLNGKLVSRYGAPPPDYLPQTAGRVRLVLPGTDILKNGNLLAVRVLNESEFGGLVGVPTLAFQQQGMAKELGNLQQRRPGKVLEERHSEILAESLIEYASFLLGSDRAKVVNSLCEVLLSGTGLLPSTANRLRCLELYAAWLGGDSIRAADLARLLDYDQPLPYETALAISRLDATPNASGVVYVGEDVATQGDWDMRYGVHNAILCAACAPVDSYYGIGQPLRFTLATGSVSERPRAWLGAPSTQDPRALFHPMFRSRRYASWDDHGETRPFDDNGPDLILRLSTPAGAHLLSFYIVDWDWHHGQHPRMESITIREERPKTRTKSASSKPDPLPVVVFTGKLGAGKYERFLIDGSRDLTVRISKHRSACAVVSGIYLDRVLPLQLSPAGSKEIPEAPASLAEPFNVLVRMSEFSVPGTLLSNELVDFMQLSSKLSEVDQLPAIGYWWLAECLRIKADFAASQKMVRIYLEKVRLASSENESRAFFAQCAKYLDESFYRPETVLAFMSAACDGDPRGRDAIYDMVKSSRRASIGRACDRWLSGFGGTCVSEGR